MSKDISIPKHVAVIMDGNPPLGRSLAAFRALKDTARVLRLWSGWLRLLRSAA